MNQTPCQLVWQAHGSPKVDGCVKASGRCYVCVGEMTRGTLVQDWLLDSFTDQNRARCPTATHVCEACVYIHARMSPVLGRPAKEGKKFGANFRNVSHLWEQDWDGIPFGESPAVPQYANASKGAKPLIRGFLARHHDGPWFAAIGDSGQKHVLPFAPMNGPGRGGRVIFEEAIVQVPENQTLVTDMMHLLTAGASKDEVESGNYRPETFIRCAAAVQVFECTHGHERSGAWFRLAIWLAQRDEEAVAIRQADEAEAKKEKQANAKRAAKRRSENQDRRSAPLNKSSVSRKPRSERPKALEPDPGPSPVRDNDVREPARVDHEAAARPAVERGKQLGLPGFS